MFFVFVNTKNVIKQIYNGRFEFDECKGESVRSDDNPYGLCIAKCGQSCSDKRRTCNSGGGSGGGDAVVFIEIL
jgi:hypothetical protein